MAERPGPDDEASEPAAKAGKGGDGRPAGRKPAGGGPKPGGKPKGKAGRSVGGAGRPGPGERPAAPDRAVPDGPGPRSSTSRHQPDRREPDRGRWQPPGGGSAAGPRRGPWRPPIAPGGRPDRRMDRRPSDRPFDRPPGPPAYGQGRSPGGRQPRPYDARKPSPGSHRPYDDLRPRDRGGPPPQRRDAPGERGGQPPYRGAPPRERGGFTPPPGGPPPYRPGPPPYRGDPSGRRPGPGDRQAWRPDRAGSGGGGWQRPEGGGTPWPRPSDALPSPDLLGTDEELVAGRRPVEEVFAAGRAARRLLVVPQRRSALEQIVLHATRLRIPIVEVEGGSLTAIAGFDGHQGVAVVVEPREFASVADILARAAERGEPPFVLVLDSLEDPQNVGTLLRSAEAAGVHGIIFPTRRQAPLSPAAVKASAGAVEHLLLSPVDDLAGALADLHAKGVRVAGSEADAPLTARQSDLRGPLAIVIGSEGQGLGPAVRKRCDLFMRIPMRGSIGSLNAAVAGSILLFEAVAQREPTSHPISTAPVASSDASRAERDASPGSDEPIDAGKTLEPATSAAPADAPASSSEEAPSEAVAEARSPRTSKTLKPKTTKQAPEHVRDASDPAIADEDIELLPGGPSASDPRDPDEPPNG